MGGGDVLPPTTLQPGLIWYRPGAWVPVESRKPEGSRGEPLQHLNRWRVLCAEGDAAKSELVLAGDAARVVGQLVEALAGAAGSAGGAQQQQLWQEWVGALQAKVGPAKEKLAARLKRVAHPLDYSTALAVLRGELLAQEQPPVVVSEGANTM